MPKRKELTWDESRNQWTKVHEEVIYFLGDPNAKRADKDNYAMALDEWYQRLSGLEQIKRDALSPSVATAEVRYQRSLIRLRLQLPLETPWSDDILPRYWRELDRGSPTSAG